MTPPPTSLAGGVVLPSGDEPVAPGVFSPIATDQLYGPVWVDIR